MKVFFVHSFNRGMFSLAVGHCVPCFAGPQVDCWRIGSSDAGLCQRHFGIWWKNKWCDNRNIGTMLFRKTDWHLMPTLVTINDLLSFGFDRFRFLKCKHLPNIEKSNTFYNSCRLFLLFGFDRLFRVWYGRRRPRQSISLLFDSPVFGVFSSCQNWQRYQAKLRGNEFFSKRTYLFYSLGLLLISFSVFFLHLSNTLFSITQCIILGNR